MTTPTTSPKKNRLRGWLKFIAFCLVLSFALFFGGFVSFAQFVENLKPPQVLPKADGIVVFTGKGGGRLDTGAELLSGGFGERLLISGVNPDVSSENVISVLNLTEDLTSCCVDFDNAKNTKENAVGTAAWTQALAFEHIILVTSAYHMPRAQTEITNAGGRIKITSYPVTISQETAWWKDKARTRRLFQEYGKLIFSYLTEPSTKYTRTPPLLDKLPTPEPEPLDEEAPRTDGAEGNNL